MPTPNRVRALREAPGLLAPSPGIGLSRQWLLPLLVAMLLPGVAFAQTPTPARPASAGEDRPWRAHEALGLSWLRFGLEHRSRFEHLENDFRTANPGNATGFSMRTLLSAELRFLPVVVGFELQDSRIWASDTTPMNTTLTNPLEPLQAYVGLRAEGLFARGDSASLTAGRMTIDLGSRRLVARNDFRNTINGFTGLELRWTSPARDVVRAFAVMPVVRLPSDAGGLRNNRIEIDRENTDALLWAAFFQSRPLGPRIALEVYLIGLHERDGDATPSPNRHLYTPGFRALRPPAPGQLDFQLEVMGQFGWSRASAAATDTTDLDHLAFALHASTGFQFNVSWAPRLVLLYDYASGDRSPTDGSNNRFDPLFAARRFEFGPTGLYGAIARSNVSAPGLRFEVQPHRAVDAFAAYRLVGLASATDAWTTAALRDPSGNAGSLVGQQVEARVRWHVFPRNLVIDVGGALFVRGDFARNAPGGEAPPSVYVYSQVTGTI